MWHGFHWFPGMLFGFFIVAMIVRGIMFRRHGRFGCCGRMDGRFEAETLLRRRLVNGEINEEEYLRLKAILKQK